MAEEGYESEEGVVSKTRRRSTRPVVNGGAFDGILKGFYGEAAIQRRDRALNQAQTMQRLQVVREYMRTVGLGLFITVTLVFGTFAAGAMIAICVHLWRVVGL